MTDDDGSRTSTGQWLGFALVAALEVVIAIGRRLDVAPVVANEWRSVPGTNAVP